MRRKLPECIGVKVRRKRKFIPTIEKLEKIISLSSQPPISIDPFDPTYLPPDPGPSSLPTDTDPSNNDPGLC
jgi:hypothetical protein